MLHSNKLYTGKFFWCPFYFCQNPLSLSVNKFNITSFNHKNGYLKWDRVLYKPERTKISLYTELFMYMYIGHCIWDTYHEHTKHTIFASQVWGLALLTEDIWYWLFVPLWSKSCPRLDTNRASNSISLKDQLGMLMQM